MRPVTVESPNVVDVDYLRHLQSSLADPMMDDDSLRRRLEGNFALIEAFARTWQTIALERHPHLKRIVDENAGPLLDVGCLKLTPLPVAAGARN